jgi:hypothetical protein
MSAELNCQGQQKKRVASQEKNKVQVIARAEAVVDEGTVMVELFNTAIADLTVETSF